MSCADEIEIADRFAEVFRCDERTAHRAFTASDHRTDEPRRACLHSCVDARNASLCTDAARKHPRCRSKRCPRNESLRSLWAHHGLRRRRRTGSVRRDDVGFAAAVFALDPLTLLLTKNREKRGVAITFRDEPSAYCAEHVEIVKLSSVNLRGKKNSPRNLHLAFCAAGVPNTSTSLEITPLCARCGDVARPAVGDEFLPTARAKSVR
jgi:hypothetical protein